MRFTPFSVTLALALALSAPALAQEPPAAVEPAPAASGEPAAPAAPPGGGEAEHPPPHVLPHSTGWFRIDTDGLGTQLWAGATHPVSDTLSIASDIYVVGTFGEFDLGVTILLDKLALTPMVGIGFDYYRQRAEALIAPQLFTIYNADSVYFESWIQLFLNDVFHKDNSADVLVDNYLYTRNFLLYKLGTVGLGPQVELSYSFRDAEAFGRESALYSLQVGAHAELFDYGADDELASQLGIFVGTELQEDGKHDQGDGIVGRLTFLHYF